MITYRTNMMSMPRKTLLLTTVFFSVISLLWPSAVPLASEAEEDGSIRPYSENPWYWEFQGKPILLRGARDDDNLFQCTDQELTDHLDLLVSVGGNYLRNAMSDCETGNAYAFAATEEGVYDLDQWNDEYWDRLVFFLNETESRGLIVQLTLWDQFDLQSEHPAE